ncbi:MAG TPA: HAD-IA family hydrolase [Candidatus Saccharimonadales bacterium]|nr:HAD-IA family hydrolase [Candidatus Saccharimonadales bacterium]
MLRAGIFDIDGLLIDSEPFWRQAHVKAVASNGGKITEDDVRAMAGRRTDEVVNHWRENHGVAHVPPEKLEKAVVEQVKANIRKHGKALPGAYKLLKMFQDNKIPVALASSSAQDIIDAVVETLEFAPFIQFSRSAKAEKQGKPHPDLFLNTAKLLESDPADCVVFEDALSGITAAKAAGMKCITVPEAVNIEKPEFHELADMVKPSLEDVTWRDVISLWSEK